MRTRARYSDNNNNQAASMAFKVRISKGFVDAAFGEGFLVEVWDYRTQRLLYGERYKELERARRRQREIKSDLGKMSVERFRQAYFSRQR
ncbi:MAG: hypothetical protein ACOC78_00815 [Actinomycetota bacterium]